MNVKRLLISLLTLTCLVGLGHAQRTVNLTAWTIGPDEPAVHRAENLEAAAELLNAELEAEGADYRVAIETDFETVSWDDHRRRLLLAFDAGNPPDILLSSHVDIAVWADAGYLMPFDAHLDQHEQFGDIVPSLWDFVTYRGQVWGIPINPEARPLYFNKVLLAELGWSEEEIETLPERIRQGEFTWDDVIAVGREAVEAGVVEEGHGYWHRPAAGPDFYHTYQGFGGRLQDPETGQLIFTRDAALGQFTLYRDLVEQGVMLRDIIGMDWNTEWHPGVIDGRVLFWSAGIWSWAQWAVQFGMGYDAVWESFGFALHPAAPEIGQPITLSQPLAYMVSARSPNQEIAVRLLSHVVTPELDLRAMESGHLPILESTRALPEFQENRFISQVIYMLDYTTAQAIHPGFGRYNDIFFRSISAVEAGQLTPEEAVELTVEELQRALGDQVIIE
jgi:inositol-phosphate transport system substrate-binding protein